MLTHSHKIPAAAKAAASCFVNLVVKESDNNVTLIDLGRLDALCSRHEGVLDGLIMDVLQVLYSMEVRREAMSIMLSMTFLRNVEEVVLFPKKQHQRIREHGYDEV